MDAEPIHIYIAGREEDPRDQHDLPDNVIAHYGPALHPDDTGVVDGIPCTAVPRTLIDCAEIMDEGELRQCFLNALALDLLDWEEFDAARGRVEWRPSLAMVDSIVAELR